MSAAATLNSIQSGTATIPFGNTQVVVNLGTAVDDTKAFLVFSTSPDNTAPQYTNISGQITSAGAQITFKRALASGQPAVSVKWYVAEFTSGVSVQRGSHTFPGFPLTTNKSLSPAVDPAKSFALISYMNNTGSYDASAFVRGRIINSGNDLEVSVNTGGGTNSVEWQVVEFTDSAVQTGDLSFANGDASKTAALSPTVDTTKSLLLYNFKSAGGTNIGQKMVRGVITSNALLTFDRDNTGQAIDLTWYLVEFTDSTTVQHNSEAFSTAQTQKDVTISTIDLSSSIALAGTYMRGGKTPYSTDQNPAPGWVTADLTTTTNLQLTRGKHGSATADIGWFVVDFAGSSATTTIGDGSGPSSRDVWAGGRFFGVDAFTLQTDNGTDTLTDVTITFTGSDINDVAASGVMIWRDDGGSANQWDSTDTLIGTASFSGSTASFTGLSEGINTSATQYIVTYNIDSAATVTDTLQGAVTAATVTNTLVNNDNVDATLTIEAESVHETSVYKIGYSPNAFEELFFKESSSPATDSLTAMSLGSIYSTTPGSLIPAWDPNATVSTLLSNSVVKRVQMSGDLIDSAGATYGTVTTTTNFYEDRAVLDIDMNITTNPAGTDSVFMTYGQYDDAILDETLWWSSNNSGSYNSEDPPPNNTGDQTAPISFQWLLELGATDGLLNGTLQNIGSYSPAQLKHVDPDSGLVDIAYQKTNPGTGLKEAVVIYSFDTTTSGYDTTITEARQDDSIDPATLDFTITGGDGALSGDGFVEERGAYTLTDGDADDHVKFEFQVTTTHYAPVFEIGSWGAAAPATILVDDTVKTLGTDYNAAVSGGTLYLQYLGTLSANTEVEIGDELITGTLYSDEGTTAVSAGIQVRLLVNGVTKGLDVTNASGRFSFATPLSAGDKLLVYVDEDDADVATDGTTVSVSDGNDLTGLDVYYQHLITRHDNAGALTNALMKTAVEPYVDTEILYSVDGSNNLTTVSDAEIFIPAGHTFTPGANVTTQGVAGNVDLRGTLTAGTSVITVTGDWDSSAGTFNRDTSTLVLNGASNTFTPKDNQNFHNLTVGAGADITVVSSGGADNLVVYETLIINGSISVPAAFTMTQRFSVPGTTTTIGAAGILSGAGTFERIVYKPILTFSNATGITISNFTYRLTYTNDNVVTIPAVAYGGNLTVVAHSASDVAEAVTIAAGTLTVGGDLVIESSTNDTTSTTLRNSDNDATINVTGNLIVGNATTSGDTSFVTGDAITTVGGNVTIIDDAESNNTIAIDASDGTPTISVAGNWDSSGGIFTYGSSTVALTGTGNLKTPGANYTSYFYNLDMAAATKTTTLQSHVGVANVISLNTGTVTGAFDLGALANSGAPLSNAGATVSTNALYYRPVNGTVTVAGGTYGVSSFWLWPSGSNATFNLAGDFTTTASIIVDVDTGNTGVTVNTQNNALTAFHLDFGEPGYDGSSTMNFGSSIVDLSGRLSVGSNGGSHTLNLDSATISVERNWAATAGTGVLTVNPGTSTVTFDGALSRTVDSGGSAFYNLVINKTDGADANDNLTVQTSDLTINGSLTITDGELIQTRSITTGAVTLSDASSKWTNVTDNANVTLFSTVANTGAITFDAPTGDLIQIRSSVGGTQRNWQGSGAFSMTDVDVLDQTAIGGTPANITVTSGTNSGNNVNWLFGGTKTISGTVYTDDDEATTLNNKAITVVVYDGVTQTSYTTTTNGSGVYTINNALLSSGDIVLVYLNDEAEEGLTVLESDGANIADLNVYQDHAGVRSHVGAVSNADMGNVDDGDDDVKYNVAAGNLTVDTGFELFIFAPNATSVFTPGGNVTTQGTGGSFEFHGTVNAETYTFTIGDDWIRLTGAGGGAINVGTSTVIMAADDGAATINNAAQFSGYRFHNLVIAASKTVTSVGTGYYMSGDLTLQANSTFTKDSSFVGLEGDLLMDFTSTFNVNGVTFWYYIDDSSPDIERNSTITGTGAFAYYVKPGSTAAPVTVRTYDCIVEINGQAGNIAALSDPDVLGVLSLGSHDLRIYESSGNEWSGATLDNPADINITTTGDLIIGTTFNGRAGKFIPHDGAMTFGNVLINDPHDSGSNVIDAAAGASTGSVWNISGNVTINGGGSQLGTLTAGPSTWNVAGDWSNSGGTFTAGTSTVIFDGTANATLDTGGTGATKDFNNLAINKTNGGSDYLTLQTNELVINGTFTITDGRLDQNDRDITIGGLTTVTANGAWDNASDGDVTLGGDVANAGTITFDATTAAPDGILIRSSVGGTQRNWQGSGTFNMTDVDVQDQTAIGGTPANILVTSGTNSGNNINWLFGTKSIGGAVYTDDDEATTLNNKAIKIVVYDGSQQTTYITSSDGVGIYGISNIALADTDIVAVYLDDEVEEGITAFKSDGNNVANLSLYQNHVSIRSDSGAISNAEIATADNGDDDVKYNVVGNDITLDSNYELFVFSSSNYTPGGNVDTQGVTGDVDIRGTLTGGTDTFNVSGDWDHSSGSFTANTSTIVMTGAAHTLTAPTGNQFYNLTINSSAVITAQSSSNLFIGGALTISGTFNVAVGKTFTNQHDLILNDNSTLGGAGTFSQSRRGSSTGDTFGSNVTISVATYQIEANGGVGTAPGKTITGAVYEGDMVIRASGNFSNNYLHVAGGDLAVNGTLTIMDGWCATCYMILDNSAENRNITAGNLVIGNSGDTTRYGKLIAGTGAIDINGDATIHPSDGNGNNEVDADTSTWTISGNWTNNDTYTKDTSTVTLDGTSQIVSGSTTFYNLTKAVTSADTLTFQAGQTQTLAAGGALSFTGTSGNLLQLRSSTPGTEWFLTVNAGVAPIANYVDVKDSNASGGQTMYAYYSVDAAPGGTNTNWVFGQQLQLVKQVWDASGSTCLASVPSDAACSGGATAVAVPAGNPVYFFIYVRNPMAVRAPDTRFQDLLDDTAFAYQTGTLQRTLNDGTAGQPSDVASAAAIFAAATTAQTDALDGDTQIDEFAGIDTTASPDNLTVGGSGAAGQNDTLSLPAHKSFGLRFRAVQN